MPRATVEDLWEQLEAWLSANADLPRFALAPGASADRLAAIEAALGATLPDAARDCWAMHDGQAAGAVPLFSPGALHSLESMLEDWRRWNDLARQRPELRAGEVHGAVRARFWSAKWIPFTRPDHGETLCIDLDPAPGGEAGQVIRLTNELAVRSVEAPSFFLWFSREVERLTSGTLAWSERDAAFVPKDQAAVGDAASEIERELAPLFPIEVDETTRLVLSFSFVHDGKVQVVIACQSTTFDPARTGDLPTIAIDPGKRSADLAGLRERLERARLALRSGTELSAITI